MHNISLAELLKFTNSKLISGSNDSEITGFSTDSRSICRGDFFIALGGPNFDAHDFIIECVIKGASGFVFSKKDSKINSIIEKSKEINPKIIILKSNDAMEFLKSAAAGYIRKRKAVCIGITGSTGKTTTKNLLTAIMRSHAKTVYTEKNYNNEIGVCKSIFNIEDNTDFFIAELGMRGKGQIKELSEICRVKYGIITNVGPSHLEFFKDTTEIAAAKAEIGEEIFRNSGVLFLNSEDKHTSFIKSILKCKIIECGNSYNLEYNFSDTSCSEDALYGYNFNHCKDFLFKIELSIPGYHNIYNSLLAAAFAKYLNINDELISKALKSVSSRDNRMDIISKESLLIIDDCYNANPLSLKSAADTLKMMSENKCRRSVAVIGDMYELGRESEKIHFECGKYIAEQGIDILISLGNYCKNLNEGFKKNKKNNASSYHFESIREMLASLKDIIRKKDIILVKGSRANKMESIIEHIWKEDFK